MPEHTIPESLIENIRSGRAALVVGAGMGVPSWKQVLERMNEELEARGQDGDDAAAKDVGKLLHKGNLGRAAGFLARTLGPETCDRVLQDCWQTPDELPEVARRLARLPFRALWTTFPGDLIERALVADAPDDWPEPQVATYDQLDELSRRRYVLKVLGDFESYVVTPHSVRARLAKRDDLRAHVGALYAEGALVFVGFRFGDPDLSALLDRVFGALEPPQSDHYLLASGVGPVTVDELAAEHHIEVVNLPGKGADEKATASLLEYLDALAEACEQAGVSLAVTRPADDDLDGWIAVLADEPEREDAREAVEFISEQAREDGDADRLVESLLARVEIEGEASKRAALLRDVARAFEDLHGDLPKAFTALTAALREDPANTGAVDDAERLARETDGWAELVGDVSQIAGEIEDKDIAAYYLTRLGTWYLDDLRHVEYAAASFRQALKHDPSLIAAHEGLAEALRKQQRWPELAEQIEEHLEVEADGEAQVDLLLSLGDLYETQLAQTGKAQTAYERAVEIDGSNQDSLAALERLYRRDDRWASLADVLERRAELFEEDGDAARAAAIRTELGTLRAEKLGDLDGAIARYEAVVDADATNAEALRALLDLYDRSGRTDDYLACLSKLADAASDDERVSVVRRLAAELAERPARRADAVEAYERLLELDGAAEDAYRALGRLHTAAEDWYALTGVVDRQIESAGAPALKLSLHGQLGDVYEEKLADPHRAIEAHLNALSIDDEHRPALEALARLYQRVEAWDRAVDTLTRRAALEGEGGAEYWSQAAALAAEHLDNPESAEQWFEKALAMHENYLPAMLGLARLFKANKSWANAVARLSAAEKFSQNRLERIALLAEAADISEMHLDNPEQAFAFMKRVLELDPEHVEAGERVADRLVAEERWEEAEPVLEMLVRRSDDEDRRQKARRATLLGTISAELGKHERATKHFRAALDADVDSLDAALGLADMLYRGAQATAGDGVVDEAGQEAWQKVDRRYREILARHRTNLSDSQVVDLWFRIATAARAQGQDQKADNALRRALERDPNHRPTLLLLAEVAEVRQDWKTVADAKRDLLDTAGDDERVMLHEQIGDLFAHQLEDTDRALGAYLEAIKARPTSHVLLHKALDLYTVKKQWRPAIDTLDQIARTESQVKRRAKYHYAAAVIARDELSDVELAVGHFSSALDDDVSTPKAFDAIDKLLSGAGDWRNLARAYRKQLKRVGDDAPHEVLVSLWSRLGDVCANHLGDSRAAMAALEVAVQLDPDDLSRREQLCDLYLEAGPDYRDPAIEELQVLISAFPHRVELYKALSALYRDAGDLDKAYCLAQALVFLGKADEQEKALFRKYRPADFTVARGRLTEELWQKSIIHNKEDRHLNAVLSSMVAPLAATTSQPPKAFSLEKKQRTDPKQDRHVASRVVGYAAEVLGLDPQPQLYVKGDNVEPIQVANTTDSGRLSPSVVLGRPMLEANDQRQIAFAVGKRLAYFRPERFIHYALGTTPRIEEAVRASLAAAGVTNGVAPGGLVDQLKSSTPSAVLEHVSAVAGKGNLGKRSTNGLVPSWRSASDLTANRVGLILCNDFETAARTVATEDPGVSLMDAKERLRDLLAYSVSENYFRVRRHLGLTVDSGA